MRPRTFWESDRPAVLISIFFLGLLLLVSLPNHYNFRTYALDLGYYLQMCEFYLRGKFLVGQLTTALPWADQGIAPPSVYVNWSVLLALPFYLAGKAWGLLVFQALLFVAGGWGIYRVAEVLFQEKPLARWSLVHYYGMWGLWSAAAFDFHEVAIATAAVPWALYFYLTGRFRPAFWAWLVAMGSKELFAIWGLFLWTGWAYLFRKTDPLRTRKALELSLWSLGYTFLLIGIGTFWAEKQVGAVSRTWLYYAYLAEPNPFSACACQMEKGWQCLPAEYSFSSLAKALARIQRVWTLLWESPHPDYVGIKSELYWSFLWSGGWVVCWAPAFAWILLPIFLYKMLAANYFMWGTLHHYSLELAVMGPIMVAWAWKGQVRRRLWVPIAALLAHLVQVSLLDSRTSKWYDPTRHRWYQAQHYKSAYAYPVIHAGLAKIPSDVPVSAVSCLIPHLPAREKLYHFPSVGEAQYIALLEGEEACTYPLSSAAYERWVDSVRQSRAWQLVHREGGLLVLKRAPTK